MQYTILLLLAIFGISQSAKQRIFLIGDSTMANKKEIDYPETGWGQVLPEYFTNVVEIQNHAVNGRSTKSFRTLGHWSKVISEMGKDDYVIIQFGHNDAKADDTLRYAPATTAYKTNLIKFIDEARGKGAIPILCTPVYRRKFDEHGKIIDSHGAYPAAVKEVALLKKVDIIDLHALSGAMLQNQGEDLSKYTFMNFGKNIHAKFPKGLEDNTHFSPTGARSVAALFCGELMKQRHPLRNFLKHSVYPEKYEHELPNIMTTAFAKDTFNIVNYGAVSSGVGLNTQAIQSAIDNAAKLGGGVVMIPKGLWLTGPIVLKDNINLHVAQGAILQFSDDRNQYPIVTTSWEGQDAYRCQAPISARNCSNIAITGGGLIDGAGQVWKSVKRIKLTDAQWKKLIASGGVHDESTWYPTESSKLGHHAEWAKKIDAQKSMQDYLTVKDFLRPNMISLIACNVVLIEGVTITNSPAWTIHPLMCKHTTVRHVNVTNPWFGQNNDAIDLESCSYGILDGCYFDTGDDAITIKSGRDGEGRKRGMPTENWIIKDTKVMHGHGGFVIGSEMSGGVKNLFVNNCTFVGTDIGLRFKTTRGRGGEVSNIYISDIHMSEIVGEAILFDMFYAAKDPIKLSKEDEVVYDYDLKPFTVETPTFKDFYFENIHCKGAEYAIKIEGLPESNLKNCNIKNASFSTNKGIHIGNAKNVILENVTAVHKNGNLLDIINSSDITFINFKHTLGNAKLGSIGGHTTKNIKFLNSSFMIKSQFEFNQKADSKSIQYK
jgi:DNA sulfur modification protein DndE